MIGAVGGQDSLLTDTLQIVNVLGGRETCNVVEIAVEMAVVGEAILAEQGVRCPHFSVAAGPILSIPL